jgi:hypothetical protein
MNGFKITETVDLSPELSVWGISPAWEKVAPVIKSALTYEKILAARDMMMAAPIPNFYYEIWRFPRSKKKRIRKKWRNDIRNWRLITDSYEVKWGQDER